MIFKSVLRVVIIIIVAVIVLLAVAKYELMSVIEEDKTVRVPNLVGLDVLDAVHSIEEINQTLDKKIVIKLASVLSDEHLKYTVIKQEPNPENMTIKEGRTIILKISKGGLTSKVPNYIDRPFKKVRLELISDKLVERSLLKDMKFEIKILLKQKRKKSNEKIKELRKIVNKKTSHYRQRPLLTLGSVLFTYHKTISAGNIISQKPSPGRSLHEDSQIHFVVSLGNEEEILTVGNYVGQRVEKVAKILSERNIFIKLKESLKHQYADGTITAQNVKANSKLAPGDEITLTVSNRMKANVAGKYHTIQFIIPGRYNKQISKTLKSGKGNRVQVKILLKDQNNESILFKGTRTIGNKIVEVCKVIGKGKVEIYIEKKLYKTYPFN